MRSFKRLFACFLALLMVLSVMPTVVAENATALSVTKPIVLTLTSRMEADTTTNSIQENNLIANGAAYVTATTTGTNSGANVGTYGPYVTDITNTANSTLSYTVNVASASNWNLTIYYVGRKLGTPGAGIQYNSRDFMVSVNGNTVQHDSSIYSNINFNDETENNGTVLDMAQYENTHLRCYLPPQNGGINYDAFFGTSMRPMASPTTSVSLNAGENTITFYNDYATAPDYVYAVLTPKNIAPNTYYLSTEATNTLTPGYAEILYNNTANKMINSDSIGWLGGGSSAISFTVNAAEDSDWVMTLISKSQPQRTYYIGVNSTETADLVSVYGADEPAATTISLKQGQNTITLMNPNSNGWCPDFASFTLAYQEISDADTAAAAEVTMLIGNLGTITSLDQETAVVNARTAYNALTDQQKLLVNNLSTLTAAEATIAVLKDIQSYTERKTQQSTSGTIYEAEDGQLSGSTVKNGKVLSFVTDLDDASHSVSITVNAPVAGNYTVTIAIIDMQGRGLKVTVNDDTENAFVATTNNGSSEWSGDSLSGLNTFETALVAGENVLKFEKNPDSTYAPGLDYIVLGTVDAVVAAINALGEITSLNQETTVAAARAGYNALTTTQKANVTNLETLEAAEAAITLLKDQDADYTKVNEAKAKAQALDSNLYTTESWDDLQAAILAVVEGKKITEQTTVDGYASAIETAISALQWKVEIADQLEMTLGIEAGMITPNSDAAEKYDITWNGSIVPGENTSVDEINETAIVLKSYGVYYATGDDVLADIANASSDQIRQVIFAQQGNEGADATIYTRFSFRLIGVTKDRVRAAMFYLEYEMDGITYTIYSPTNEATAR